MGGYGGWILHRSFVLGYWDSISWKLLEYASNLRIAAPRMELLDLLLKTRNWSDLRTRNLDFKKQRYE